MAQSIPPPLSNHNIGWVGLGNMGLAMATNLQRYLQLQSQNKSYALHYYNRTISRGEPLRNLGGIPCDGLLGLCRRCDVVFLSLSDDEAVKGVVGEIVSTDTVRGKIIVDTSTISPGTTAAMTGALSAAGATYLAAPAFGATPVAVQGRLLFALAGSPSAISIIKPIIEACLARSVIVVGEDPAKATLLKTTGNFITAAMAETMSEAHVLAEKAGLSNDVLDELIRENYGAYAHSISRKLVEGLYCPPRGERARSDLVLAIKDVSHGIDAAKEVGMRLKLAEVTMEHLLEAKKWADGQQRALDSSAVYGVVRTEAGLEFESTVVKNRDAGLR